MFNNTKKIDKYLKDRFNIIYDFNFNGLILLMGGTIKDILMGKEVKDLDFTLLTQNNPNIEDFIKKYKLKYKRNIYKGYKINYNGIDVDITSVNDLFDAGHLSTDFLFYDIKRKYIIPYGVIHSIRHKTITDYYYQGYFRPKARIKKAKEFINYFNSNSKKVKVRYKYNKIIALFRAFIKHPSKLVKRGNYTL